MAYFVADEKLQGYYVSDGVTINIVKYHFECDDAASLPAQTAFISSKKVKISMASTAHTIDTDALYKMDSSGAWVKQSQPWQPLADYSVLSNKPEINGHTLIGNQSGADLGLQNTLTFDNTPTQSSTNPVTSGGIWTDQQRQEAEIGVVANAGAKNLLNTADAGAFPRTVNGVTYNESGGVIMTSGTATTTTTLKIPIKLTAGTYIISGCPSGGSDNTYRIDMRLQGTATVVGSNDYGSGFSLTVDTTTDYDCCIRFYNGSSAEGLTFKPMIRSAAISDPTFQPYARTNRELTVLTDEDRASLVEIVDSWAKNKLQNTAISDTVNGVTFTVNSDGTITVTGEVVSPYNNAIFNIGTYTANQGDVLSSGLAAANAKAYIYARGGTTSTTARTSIEVKSGDLGVSRVYAIGILAGTGSLNLTFRPMICTKAAWNVSHEYQPYRPSWQEMYEMILALQ